MSKTYFISDGTVATIQPIVNKLLYLKGTWEIVIQEPQRSNKQNRLFHDNISILAAHSGDDIETMKDIIKCLITDDQILNMSDIRELKNGRIVTVYRSTKDLTKSEFTRLIEYVYMTGEKLGLKMIYPADREIIEELEPPKEEDLIEMAQSIFADGEEGI